jgi:hypothetical protein
VDGSKSRVPLAEVVPRVGTQFAYLYDFGDSWEHDLVLEAILLPETATQYPTCIGGERRTPPEDVGGTPGYEEYLVVLTDPEHEEHANMLRWRGPFDPEAFSAAQVNQKTPKAAPLPQTGKSSQQGRELIHSPRRG